jgi:hypothetical protein
MNDIGGKEQDLKESHVGRPCIGRDFHDRDRFGSSTSFDYDSLDEAVGGSIEFFIRKLMRSCLDCDLVRIVDNYLLETIRIDCSISSFLNSTNGLVGPMRGTCVAC